MFAINQLEMWLTLFWILGVVGALVGFYTGTSRRRGLGAVVIALIVPILGSAWAIYYGSSSAIRARRVRDLSAE